MDCPSCGNANREGARFCDVCGARLEPAEAPPDTGVVDADRTPVPESVADGRYQVERFLGRGGRKLVYLARDTHDDDRQVAVAVFETEGVEETVLARARREAQAMGRLGRHPHIVAVYDTGEENGSPYLVSEFMPGGDVEGLLRAAPNRRLEPERAIAIATDICRALEHAHSRGIVHRDIKPANIWIGDDGAARLGDFGLAATDRRSRAAVEGMLVGTVAYLPPEQALGRASDARADLYSLGAVLYEITTGQPPFPGDDAVAVISQHLNAEPVSPKRHEPAIPPGLDRLILHLLAKAPADRPESAAAARAELEAVAAGGDAEAEAEPAEEAGGDNPLEGLAGGVFVGRDRELAEMRGALEDALGGRGRLLLLVGEPGIGKTRTTEELATYAAVRGAKVHWGRCHEGEAAPAYWPWTEAIRSYVREADPVGLAWELGGGGAEVARIVPEIRERVSGLPEPPELDPEQARFRLFDSIATFLTGASSSRPIVLVLDDLHWADASSLELLKFVARQLSDTGLLVVATYRDVELGRHHPLAGALGELAATEHCTRLALRGLDSTAVARFIQMSAGAPPPQRLVEIVADQTEGNPFFVSEVVRLLVSEGKLDGSGGNGKAAGWEVAIPQGVREVVGRRLDRLSEQTNEILTLGAAIGREFDLDVLESICGPSREEIERGLAEAIDAQLISETRKGAGRYSFSHALVRETLYEEIPAARRVQLHCQIGEALERLYAEDPGPHLAELAHHFLEGAPAGDVDRAVDYAERAARSATDQLAHDEAVAHLKRALDALEVQRRADQTRRLELTLELGEAQTRAGRLADARETLEAAAVLAREADDAESLARAALDMSVVSEAGSADERIIDLIEQALEALDEGDSGTRSQLLSALAQEVYWVDAQGKAVPLSLEALEMARRIGDQRALAAALVRRQFAGAVGPDATRERLVEAKELHDLAKGMGDLELELRAHAYRLRDYLELGDIAAVDRELKAYDRISNELRMPQHRWHAPLLRGMRALIEGRFADSERLAAEALEGGERAQEPIALQFYGIQTSLLRRHQGRSEEMLPIVEQLADRYPAIPAWRCALATIHSDLGHADEARRAFEQVAANDFADIPQDANRLVALSLLSEAAAFLGDRPRAQRLYDLIRPYDGLNLVAGRAAACYGPVGRLLGMLARVIGRHADAERHLEGAIELCGRMGERPFAATARYELAVLFLERGAAGDTERGLELLGACLDEGHDLGMRRLIEQALAARLEAQGISSLDTTTSIDYVISAVESERPDLAAHAAPDGTVTILFSDIENSTLMTERLGDTRWLEVLRAHNTVFRRHLRSNRGYEVKSQGDGFMLVFPDPREALTSAIGIQRDLAEAAVAADEHIRVRMGMHTGEAIHEEGDFFGRSVILAARIAAQATGGEILVSEALKERVEANEGSGDDGGADELGFDGGRELELKGMAGTHTVYRAEWEPQASPAPAG
jgi:class 3 adenylate cyclase